MTATSTTGSASAGSSSAGSAPGPLVGVVMGSDSDWPTMAAAAVALAGPVGFVGLLVPHALRRLRPPSTRALMAGCALWGAVLVILADLAGRLVVAPGEIHLGVTTVLLGVPVLLALLRRPGVAA